MKIPKISIPIFLLTLFLLSACSGGGGSGYAPTIEAPNAPPIKPSGIKASLNDDPFKTRVVNKESGNFLISGSVSTFKEIKTENTQIIVNGGVK